MKRTIYRETHYFYLFLPENETESKQCLWVLFLVFSPSPLASGFRWRWWNETLIQKNQTSKSMNRLHRLDSVGLFLFRWCDTQWFQMQILSRNMMKNAIFSCVAVEKCGEKCSLIFPFALLSFLFGVKISVCFENTHITTTKTTTITTLSKLPSASIDCVLRIFFSVLLLFSTINGFEHCV